MIPGACERKPLLGSHQVALFFRGSAGILRGQELLSPRHSQHERSADARLLAAVLDVGRPFKASPSAQRWKAAVGLGLGAVSLGLALSRPELEPHRKAMADWLWDSVVADGKYNAVSPFASLADAGQLQDVVEPKTGLTFPGALDEKRVLTGTGLRRKSILGLKKITVYAYGELGDKYGKLDSEDVKKDEEFLKDVMEKDVALTVRLVIAYGHLKIGSVRSAFEESVGSRIKKFGDGTDNDLLKRFTSAFTDEIMLPKGTSIDLNRLPGSILQTKMDFRSPVANFREHQAAVTQQHGEAYSMNHFSEAVYIISIGSNDYLGGYYGNPGQHEKYTPEQFVSTVVTDILTEIETLCKLGATKIVVLGLGPMGCLPALRLLDPSGSCLKPLLDLGTAHNGGMMLALDALESMLPTLTIIRTHFFDFFLERLENPSKYGYENAGLPCCGAGPCAGRCRQEEKNKVLECELCMKANKYVWWDMYHPSESVHKQFADAIWNGSLPYVQPRSVAELFKPRAGPSCSDKLDLFAGNPLQ